MAQASMLLLVGFAFLRSGSYQKPWTGIPGLPRYFFDSFLCLSLCTLSYPPSMHGSSIYVVASWFCVSSLWLLPMPAARSSSESRSVANARSKFWVTSPMISPSFLLQSLLVGIRSVLGRLSDGNWCFPLGFQPPKWGARKYYLHSPQPESGRCGLQVILLDLEKREKFENKLLREPPGPPETADLGGSAQASMLLLVGFAFLRSGSYQKQMDWHPRFAQIFF